MAGARRGVAPLKRVVALAYFLLFVGVGVWVPYFSLYCADRGLAGWEIGVASGLQPLLRWGSAIGYAWVADRWRVRHPLLVATTVLGTLCYLPMLRATDFPAFLLAICGLGVLHGPLIPLFDATVMDHLPALGGDYGRLRLWGSLGFIVGACVSAPIVAATSPAIFPWLVLLPCPLLVAAFWFVPSAQLGHGEPAHAPWRLLTPPLTAFLTAGFLLQASCGAWGGFFAVHTAALGFSAVVPGFTFGLAVTVEVALLFWGRRILERVPPAPLLVVILVVTLARWVATAVARNEAVVVALQLGHVLSFTAFHLAALSLLARLVPMQSTTGGQAVYGLVAYGLGGTAGQLLAGALVDRLGTSGIFLVDAVLAALALPPALRLVRLVART